MIFFPKPDPIKISLLSVLIHKRYRNPYGDISGLSLSLSTAESLDIYLSITGSCPSVLSDKSLLDGGGLSQDI